MGSYREVGGVTGSRGSYKQRRGQWYLGGACGLHFMKRTKAVKAWMCTSAMESKQDCFIQHVIWYAF